jgi:Protein of unknown function (DUF3300)
MSRLLTVFLSCCFATTPILSAASAAAHPLQDQPPQSQDQYDQQAGPYENFSPDQLDNLLSPIALYPDPLLAQVFVAATFPDQVEEAARYVRSYGQNGVDDQDWDVSVKAVSHYPTVIGMMSDKIDWTTSLGQAYVNQSTDVASSVQRLRHLARHAGNLDSSAQQEVIENGDYIAITPYQPQYIYVPVYDPAIIYYRRPYYGPAITFGVGFPIGAWLNLDFRWGYGGGWGGVYYTGWRREGWGGGCWNCGWIGRSRERVDIRNNVYINNRYTNITVNRTVINRTVNVNNINRYNSVHRDVRYDNVQNNNMRVNRGGAGGNRPGGNDRPADNRPGNDRPGNNRPGDNRPGNERLNNSGGRFGGAPVENSRGANNKIIDSNIDRNNPRIDQYRGHDNNNNGRNDRPPNNGQPNRTTPPNNAQPNRPNPSNPPNNNDMRMQRNIPGQNQGRPPQPSVNNGPHTFNQNESHFDPRVTSQRGQDSRQQPVRPQVASPPQPNRPAAQPNRPAPAQHGGGERKKP